jgi:beta-lactam-binding protein with PASTA domain
MKSSFFKFIKSRTFLVNVIILVVFTITGFFALTGWLNNYTHHGQNIQVPDLRGKTISNLDKILAEHNFHYKVVDSLFDVDKLPGTVLDQDPAPKSKVKENRTIYLTINSTQPPDVKMPDLVDVSYRQAEAILQSFGLITGEISYESDLAKNAVLEQHFKGKKIKPGTLISKGSVIDLVLGDGLENIQSEVQVPDLTGLTQDEAMGVLLRASLSMGLVVFEEGIKDSSKAVIYKQNPLPDEGIMLHPGASIDIFLH